MMKHIQKRPAVTLVALLISITASSLMTELSIKAASELLRQKKLSPVELTTACLHRIERLNPIINTFITVTAETALSEARTAEREIYDGNWRGPLHDNSLHVDVFGYRVVMGSAVWLLKRDASGPGAATIHNAGADFWWGNRFDYSGLADLRGLFDCGVPSA